MAQNAYTKICTDINTQLFRRLERADDVRHQFAPNGTAAAVLHRSNLALWFRSLDDDELGIDEATFIQRIQSRKLYEFLAILIFATNPLEAAKRFVLQLVAVEEWPVTFPGHQTNEHLASLPATRPQLSFLFANEFHAYQFYSTQATFCAIVLQRRAEVLVDHPERQRLPYLLEQPVAEGSFGKVFKVRIASGHFYDPSSQTSARYNTEPLELARKDYLVSSEFRAEDERDIMDQILGSYSRKPENILENFGSLNIAHSTYSLFMPLAICDLRAYMMDLHKTQPTSIEAKSKFILSAVGLAEGLSFLHNDIQTPDLEELVCYHMDLKPDNILIFFENGRYVWKLSDFGMARIKFRHRTGQHREEEKDFNSWFVRRMRPNREPSTDGTVNRRGEGTYLAPESLSANPNMNTSSDVWSLGCVLSVLFTYLDGGHEGIVSYQRARMKHSQANGYDRFFIANTGFRANQVHPEVDKWHHKLIKSAKLRSLQESQGVSYALKQLETAVFRVDPRDRRSARDIVAILRYTYRLMNRSEENSTARNSHETNTMKAQLRGMTTRLRSSKKTTHLSQRAHGWRQEKLENYKGCAISPDGTLIAYWTDLKISLFTSQSLSPANEDSVTPSAEYTLQSQQYLWSSVSLAENWLIASTSGANFQCYIFDLEGGTSVDVSLERWVRLSLPEVPEIQKVAITQDAQRVVCSLRHWTDDRSPGAIFHARISDLRRYSRGRASAQLPEPTVPPWRIISVSWPASDITELVPSSNQDIYMVVQPELTYRTQEHRVSIVCLSLQTETYDTLNIEAQGLDTSNTVTLFTTFAVFHRPRAVAIVSREKRLLVQQMTEIGPSPHGTPNPDNQRPRPQGGGAQGLVPPSLSDRRPSDQSSHSGNPPTLARALTSLTTGPPPQVYEIQREISRYRIRRLIMSFDDRKFYCIGTAIASHKLLVFSIDVPATAGDELKVTELAQLGDLGYDDEFTAQLAERDSVAGHALRPGEIEDDPNGSDDDDEGDGDGLESGTYLLVAALVGRGRRAIYRVPISTTIGHHPNTTSRGADQRSGRAGTGRRGTSLSHMAGAGLGLFR
ncbi:kinase-like domain-containing protein [Microdochium trichocladiopsis]|uniref:Kinase-like domain-containing protein n=1 Tax=Microdochium trichocladiopsis TaxID=1682393 RepID=A0A9P9BN49_9PEZI|nr:kinase-like domain-containing protein [Microdochium trichocladiopsis]KAH7026591.1 kinase-like domain-containing protein [Microdochium trichocladiopsis]